MDYHMEVYLHRCCSTSTPRPARTRRHSQLHLCRRLVHRVARKRLQQHRSVTHVCPEHYDHTTILTNCVRTIKYTGVCFRHKEPISQTRTECNVERYQTVRIIRMLTSVDAVVHFILVRAPAVCPIQGKTLTPS